MVEEHCLLGYFHGGINYRCPLGRCTVYLPCAIQHKVTEGGCILPTQCICVSCEVRTAHRVYLCVSYGSHSKQRLFPQTPLTGWAL
jgi:hypothetical protein